MTSCASLVLCGDRTAVVWSRRRSSNPGRRPPMFKKNKQTNKNIAECFPVLQARSARRRAASDSCHRPFIQGAHTLVNLLAKRSGSQSEGGNSTGTDKPGPAFSRCSDSNTGQEAAELSALSIYSPQHHRGITGKTRTIVLLPYLSHHFL